MSHIIYEAYVHICDDGSRKIRIETTPLLEDLEKLKNVKCVCTAEKISPEEMESFLKETEGILLEV